MKRWFRMIVILGFLVGSEGFVEVLVPSSGMIAPAYAQGTPQGLTKLEDKVNDVANLIRKILYVFVAIGILLAGWRFIQGDPHAWRYTLGVVLGATIIFASGEILGWLQS